MYGKDLDRSGVYGNPAPEFGAAPAQTPYGGNADSVQECCGCHTPVKSRDHVFTTPTTTLP